MKKLHIEKRVLALTSLLTSLFISQAAWADTGPGGAGSTLDTPITSGGPAVYVGDLFENFAKQWGSIGIIFTALCGILAGFLVIIGIRNILAHTNGNHKPLTDGISKFMGAGLIGTLPWVLGAVVTSFYGNIPGSTMHSYYGTGSTPSGEAGTGLDSVMVNLVSSIYGPCKFAIQVITYIGGIGALFKAAWNISQSGNAQQAPPPHQTAALAVGGAILVTLGSFSDLLTNTLFGGAQTTQFTSLAYSISGMDMTHVNNVYKALFAFTEVNGFIAVARAGFMAQAIGSGKSNKTYGHAAIFFVAGVIAINMAPFVKIVGATIGIPLVNIG
jgi:hypothetical protein